MSTEDYMVGKLKEKYKILLKFLNKILVKLDKTEIQDIKQFKNIKRTDLVNEEILKVYEESKEEIHKYFGKYNLKYGQQKVIKNYILTVIRNMSNELFLTFDSKVARGKVGNKVVSYVVYEITTREE
jgi:hypothetical protein